MLITANGMPSKSHTKPLPISPQRQRQSEYWPESQQVPLSVRCRGLTPHLQHKVAMTKTPWGHAGCHAGVDL